MKKMLMFLTLIISSFLSCGNKKDFVKASNSRESIVLIKAYKDKSLYASGTGIVLQKDGYILSCGHVTALCDSIIIISGDDTLKARFVDEYPSYDFAIFKIDKKLKPIKIGNSDNIKIGQNILNIGYPLALGLTVNSGIISNIVDGRAYKFVCHVNYIQTDAVINAGNSGGALVDIKGRLIGLNEMMVTYTGYYIGYSFAIPINNIIPIADEIIKNDK